MALKVAPPEGFLARAPEYRDAATLLGDFWAMVDAVLREKGVFP